MPLQKNVAKTQIHQRPYLLFCLQFFSADDLLLTKILSAFVRAIAQINRIMAVICAQLRDSFRTAKPQISGIRTEKETSILVRANGPKHRALYPVYMDMHRNKP